MKSNIKKKKGFTLIELIIVIAIIGILAAIAVPKFGNIQKDSKIKADIATAKTISDAVSVLVTQGEIPESTATSGGVKITTDDIGTGDTALKNDEKIAAQIGRYLQSIPKSSFYKDENFKVVIAKGDATIYVNDGVKDSKDIRVYPNGEEPYNK